MFNARIIFKNGQSFEMICSSMSCSYDKASTKLTKIDYRTARKNIPLYIDFNEVVAVIYNEVPEGEK